MAPTFPRTGYSPIGVGCHDDYSDIGLLKRSFRDVHSVVSRLDTQMRRLIEPTTIDRPGGLAIELSNGERLCANLLPVLELYESERKA